MNSAKADAIPRSVCIIILYVMRETFWRRLLKVEWPGRAAAPSVLTTWKAHGLGDLYLRIDGVHDQVPLLWEMAGRDQPRATCGSSVEVTRRVSPTTTIGTTVLLRACGTSLLRGCRVA
jgi:hypothetical protein